MHKGASKTVYTAKTEDGFDSAPASASGGIASCVWIRFYHHKIEAAMKRTAAGPCTSRTSAAVLKRATFGTLSATKNWSHECMVVHTNFSRTAEIHVRHEDTVAQQLVLRMRGRSHQ